MASNYGFICDQVITTFDTQNVGHLIKGCSDIIMYMHHIQYSGPVERAFCIGRSIVFNGGIRL